MNVIKEWILVGAGLAIGKLLVAVAVIAILIVILVLLSIIEEDNQ